MLRRADLGPLVIVALTACSNREHTDHVREPLGYIPSAVTSAAPEWIPFSIRAGKRVPMDPRERHFGELRQVTFNGGDHPRWSPDGTRLIFQSTRDGGACEQILELDLGTGETKQVSPGGSRSLSGSFLFPTGDRIFYASTLGVGPDCSTLDRSRNPAWALGPFQIYAARADGSDRHVVVDGRGSNMDPTLARDGSLLVFTSTRDGDMELYTAKPDGSDLRRATHAPGYDGGASFSPDGAHLTWQTSRPTGAELDAYRAQLQKGLFNPTATEIVMAGPEGQNPRTLTKNGKINLAPAFLPDSRRVIFASTLDGGPSQPGSSGLDLYLIDPDAPPTADGAPPLDRVTYHEGADTSPSFSPDGQRFAFASSRFGAKPGDTNLFVVGWLP